MTNTFFCFTCRELSRALKLRLELVIVVFCFVAHTTAFSLYLQQSGLISRVTDTVKSIVPSWLQKYFKNEDSPEGGGAEQGTDQNCQQPPPPPNGSEEGPPSLDGRDSPEPSTSNTGQGSTTISPITLCSCIIIFN